MTTRSSGLSRAETRRRASVTWGVVFLAAGALSACVADDDGGSGGDGGGGSVLGMAGGGSGGLGGGGDDGGAGGLPDASPDTGAGGSGGERMLMPDAAAGGCIPAAVERCDGEDDDCDGLVDEGTGVGEVCVIGVGACAAEGRVVCTSDGRSECEGEPSAPDDERCNEVDDDCDGRVDEELRLGEACQGGPSRCAGMGVFECGRDGRVRCSTDVEEGPELCNELDDDCDDQIDEDYMAQIGVACEVGVGACFARGAMVCNIDQDVASGGLFWEGPRANVSEAEILAGGFELCWTGDYGGGGEPLAGIQQRCPGDVLLLGCRPQGQADLVVGAMGERAEVVRDVGDDPAAVHAHNGVDWYYSENASWGFAPPGLGVERNSCDVAEGQNELRMCWHTGGAQINPGWSCGAQRGIGGGWERVIYMRPGPLSGPPALVCDADVLLPAEAEACNNIDDNCDGAVDEGFEGLFEPCAGEFGLCMRGELHCNAAGERVCEGVPVPPSREVCNGFDDDCDETVDDVEGLGEVCTVGVGACERAGETTCGEGAPAQLAFEGIAEGLAVDELLRGGFELCWSGDYNEGGEPIADILAACDGDVLLLGCAPVGDEETLQLAAMGERAEVLQDSGQDAAAVHEHNGVGWYFSDVYSWGFAPAGAPVQRNSCDTADNGDGHLRMCWHTNRDRRGQGGVMGGGYRCGLGAQDGSPYNRFIFHRRGGLAGLNCSVSPGDPVEETCNNADDDCDGAVDEGFGVGVDCERELEVCQRGQLQCDADGNRVCVAVPVEPRPEGCNGFDDDCNGTVDDVRGVGEPCLAGQGICQAEGRVVCGEGEAVGHELQGIHENVPVQDLLARGFEECFSDTYGDGGTPLADIRERCGGDVVVIGCVPQGGDAFQLAAMGNRDDVFFDTGGGPENVHTANGVDWYFNDSWSWGFAPQGAGVELNSCDVRDVGDGHLRMCWHTGEGAMNGGYRCGNDFPGPDYRRVVLHRFGPPGGGLVCEAEVGQPEEETCDGEDDDCDGSADEDFDLGGFCEGEFGLCLRGVNQCDEAGGVACLPVEVPPEPEVCDGFDNDCNESVDDVAGLGEPCRVGVGECGAVGVATCEPDAGPPAFLEFAGIRQDVALAEVLAGGFEPCYADAFGDPPRPLRGIFEACDGEVLLIGCGVVGEGTLWLAAMGDRADVLFPVGPDPAAAHEANGVQWYYDEGTSMGFAPPGVRLERNSCDTGQEQGELRMCWHASGGNLDPGYRCGQNITFDAEWQRVVMQRRGPVATGLRCELQQGGGEPGPEACDRLDNDCDGSTDEDFDVGGPCVAGQGACRARGEVLCDEGGQPACDAVAGEPGEEVCNGVDDDCDGPVDEDLDCPFFASCQAALAAGARESGVFPIIDAEGPRNVWCDQVTDGGGWTLVASSAATFDDQSAGYYDDLATLEPEGLAPGIWGALAGLADSFDVRFACRDHAGAADEAMSVDLSFYDVPWYGEFAAADSDAASCFNELDGQGQDPLPPPARRNNLDGEGRDLGDQWDWGGLEGEDVCDDDGDFTIDFDDRGMDNDENDGTDWGEDDGQPKCGVYVDVGQWFIFVRERPPGPN